MSTQKLNKLFLALEHKRITSIDLDLVLRRSYELNDRKVHLFMKNAIVSLEFSDRNIVFEHYYYYYTLV